MEKNNQIQNSEKDPGFRNNAKLVFLIVVFGMFLLSCQERPQQTGSMKTATETPPPATSIAVSPGPILFVILKGAEKGAVSATEVTVFLKKINLPDGYDQNPIIKVNETYWLATPRGAWQVTCKSIQALPKTVGPASEKLEITLQSGSPIQGNSWLLSKTPFPPQTWQQKEVPARNVDLRVIITTTNDEFMLDSVNLPVSNEGDGPAPVRVDIHRKKKNEASWTRINSFMTNSEVRPYMDVDGDGVPEIFNLEWYSESVLRSFYPKVEVVAIDRSGV
jgi:hypothetical protein